MADQRKPMLSRKGFFGELFSSLKKGISNRIDQKLAQVLEAPLRPPGALDEVEFLATCTRCDACLDACPHHAIRKLSIDAGLAANTPFIEPRTQACLLCEDFPCITACDDHALLPVLCPEYVEMGRALIKDACMTYENKVCTLCYDACPFPEKAIEIGSDYHPRVLEACVGCGLCEYACPVEPVGVKVESLVNHRAAHIEDQHYFGVLKREKEQ